MKKVVIYQSKYGAAKKYAEWIAEELGCDLYEKRSIKPKQLEKYDTIIYGGGIYAGGISGISLLVENFKAIRDKDIILFTCGLADPEDKGNVDNIRAGLSKALTPDMLEKIKIFHLRGAMDYSKLGPVHKAMMAMLYKMMKKKDTNSFRSEDKEMLDSYGKNVDFTDRDTIKPIIHYIAEL